MANSSLQSFKSDHHYVAGLALVAVGVLGIAGSVTGSLAAMLAGLLTPTALYPTGAGGSTSSSSGSSSAAPWSITQPVKAGGKPTIHVPVP